MRRNGKGQANVHTRGISLDWSVEKVLDLGEVDDLIEFLRDLSASHPQDRAIEKDVLAPRELMVKPCTDFEQASCPSIDAKSPFSRNRDPAEKFKERTLPGSVLPDNPNNLALVDVQGHIPECPKVHLLQF